MEQDHAADRAVRSGSTVFVTYASKIKLELFFKEKQMSPPAFWNK